MTMNKHSDEHIALIADDLALCEEGQITQAVGSLLESMKSE